MYDLTIIGAGWAGFNACIKAKELGLKVALIDKGPIGGTCLNLGCIPTKTLIQSAKVFSLVKKSANFGVEAHDPLIDFAKAQERKDKIIQQLRLGMQSMLGGIDFLNGEAEILSSTRINIGDKTIETKFILIATGSRPLELADLRFDGKKIISSNEIINLKSIPKSLLIIGGGVVGCEFASLFGSLGTQVSIVERMAQLLPGEDLEVAKKLETILKKRGIKINTNSDALNSPFSDYDLVLLSIGRAAVIGDLDKVGIRIEKGKIVTDDHMQTSIPNIYAAGDCTGRIMLAHYAAYQGCIAAENIVHPDAPKPADNVNIPSCIFTDPEIASIGLNENNAKLQGREINIHKFDFLGSGMARILNETEGFTKVVSDKNTGVLLGASIIGPRATELIGIFSVAVSGGLKVSQIKQTVFAHPTLSESIHEAVK